jgi:release factor glutamine methyltransferase
MILRQALRSTTKILDVAGIADAFIEAEVLVGAVLGMSKAQLYTEPEKELTPEETRQLWHVVQRRLNREPAAYILQRCEFFGIEFYVDHGAFIPRPETEMLVEEAMRLARHVVQQNEHIEIADVGTGCGAIAISLALVLPEARVYATDISASALRIAEINCRRHGVDRRVQLLQGNLLEPLPGAIDMVVANLPYVKDREFKDLSPEIADFEPVIALAGGEDGLNKIDELLRQIPGRVHPGGALLLEIGQGQGEAVTSLVSSYFPRATVRLIPDLGGIERVVTALL